MPTIDADAHVIESERTWDYLEPSEMKFRPALVSAPGESERQYWVIDGKIRGFRFPTLSAQRLAEQSQRTGRNLQTALEAREMADVALRLRHMDELGIDIQVLHATLFIEQITDHPEVEVALCRSWNQWLGDIWQQGEGRLRWSCAPPLLSMPDALDQIRFGKAHGACAVLMRPMEGHRFLVDPYFYPLYEEASRLNLPIAVHIGNANASFCDLLRSSYDPAVTFALFRVPTAVSARQVMMSELLNLFPKLRWGFIEAGAQWLPWVMHSVRSTIGLQRGVAPEEIFKRGQIYVTCENSDDLPYILQYSGEDSLLIGTDYGHFDPSSDVNALTVFKQRTDISSTAIQKVLEDNPKTFYDL